MIRQILYMSVLWTTLIFIGYNLLTTADDNKTNMTIPNEAEGSTTTDSDSPKEICKNHDGKWKDGSCTFPNDNDRQDSEVGFDHTMEEKGLWDKYASDKKLKNICDDVDGKWTKDGCETDHDGPKADKFEEKVTELHQQEQESEPEQTVVVEDWRNTVEVEEKEPEQIIVEEWEKHHGSPGSNHEIPSTRIVELNNNDDENEDYDKKDDAAADDEHEEEEEEEEESDESEESDDDDDSSSGDEEE